MQIFILVPLRYPTEKAYGTNIAYTAEAFALLDENITIISNGASTTDQLKNKIIGIENWLTKRIRLFEATKSNSLKKIAFYSSQTLFSVYASRVIRPIKDDKIVVTRSPIVAFLSHILVKKATIILELHHLPSRLEVLLTNSSYKQIKTCVTNTYFQDELRNANWKSKVSVIPNSAPAIFHEIGLTSREFKSPLVIGFAGKASSSGNDNDLKIAVRLMIKYPEMAKKVRFTFIGCEESFVTEINEIIREKNLPKGSINFIEHLLHDRLAAEIKEFDLALLPYPGSPYYDRSFPIKVIEMAAAGVPMLASNTKAHRRLLGMDNKLLFQAGSELSLKQAINFLLENPEILDEERIRLLSWSSQYTYKNKAKKILELSRVI